jgi:phosphoglycerate dehydrogenase-like enzyme
VEVTVVNNLGAPFPEQVSSLPGLTEVIIGGDDDVPEGLTADAIFTHTWGSANLGELLTCGARWVQVMGVGVDRFPFEHLRPGQILTCARGATAIPISEFSLASMLAHAKALPDIWIDEEPEHGWFTGQRLSGLHGQTVVVVGVGGIGAEVARLSLAFGMRVIGVRRRDLPAPHVGMEITTDLNEVIGEADHLVLAAPATADTTSIIDGDLLEAVTPGLHVVNVARGSLIDQDALRAALDDGRVARASLDTVTPEPLPAGHWLYSHPGVRLSPHVSWAGPGSSGSMFSTFIANYNRFVAGEELDGVVDVESGY